jgi:hypothetical protein
MKPSLDEARECIARHESHAGFDQAFNPDCLGLASEIAVILDRREREARVEELRKIADYAEHHEIDQRHYWIPFVAVESRIRDLEAGK